MIHDLKTWPGFFKSVVSGEKTFEVRKNDRNFKAGHVLRLKEYNPESDDYTGRTIDVQVVYVLEGGWGLLPGYCAMGISSNLVTELQDRISELEMAAGDVWNVYDEAPDIERINPILLERRMDDLEVVLKRSSHSVPANQRCMFCGESVDTATHALGCANLPRPSDARPLPPEVHMTNGGQRCDMVTGPCACGATHNIEEWRDRCERAGIVPRTQEAEHPAVIRDQGFKLGEPLLVIEGMSGGEQVTFVRYEHVSEIGVRMCLVGGRRDRLIREDFLVRKHRQDDPPRLDKASTECRTQMSASHCVQLLRDEANSLAQDGNPEGALWFDRAALALEKANRKVSESPEERVIQARSLEREISTEESERIVRDIVFGDTEPVR